MSILIVRLVVFVLLFWTGWRLWRYWQRLQNPTAKQDNRPAEGEAMVPCAQCGVHLPQSSALKSGSRHFCSREHQLTFEREDKE